MKKLFLSVIILFFSQLSYGAEFPITENVEITMLEVWPSHTGTGRYGARVKDPIDSADCTYKGGFHIKDGPGAEAAYSTLMAAVAAKMNIQIYIVECGYMAVVDRVRLIP